MFIQHNNATSHVHPTLRPAAHSRAGGGHVEDHEQVGEPLRAEEVPRHRRRPQPGRACRGLPAPRLLGAAAREQRERRLVLRRRRLEPVLRDVAHLPAATGRVAVFPLSNLARHS